MANFKQVMTGAKIILHDELKMLAHSRLARNTPDQKSHERPLQMETAAAREPDLPFTSRFNSINARCNEISVGPAAGHTAPNTLHFSALRSSR